MYHRIVLAMILVFSFLTTAFAKPKQIYIVNSYNPETFVWTREINDGISKGFKIAGLIEGVDYTLASNHMDALVKTSKAEMQAEATRILKDIKSQNPDIIITTDDDALAFVGLQITDKPVVFNGVNGSPNKYLSSAQLDSLEHPGHNITGVYQMTYFKQSLNLLKKINPNSKTFAIVTDNSTTSKAILSAFEDAKSDLPLTCKEVFKSSDFGAWKTKILQLQDQVDAIYFFSFNSVTENGKKVTVDEAGQWIMKNNQLPDASCWAYQIKTGILLAAADDGGQQGLFTAKYVSRILDGTHPGQLPIVYPPNGVPALNVKKVRQNQLSIPVDVMSLFIEDGIIFK